MSREVLDILAAELGSALIETSSDHGDDTAVIDPAHWLRAATFLRDDPRCDMQMMVDLCAVDYPQREPRFDVVMHLHSIDKGHRLRLKTRVGTPTGENAELDSVVSVWPGANWFERETFDMMGISFRGHPDMRRILMYPEFVGHPLRKDYPANRIQPLVPFRQGYEKVPPFDESEGMSFGRKSYETGKAG
jgi:NADH-quinone oxidoreductase subunit C